MIASDTRSFQPYKLIQYFHVLRTFRNHISNSLCIAHLLTTTIMADYDSDSSGTEDVATNVVLGFASKEPTDEPFSQLGGHPVRSENVANEVGSGLG